MSLLDQQATKSKVAHFFRFRSTKPTSPRVDHIAPQQSAWSIRSW
jgi:hypothetical protein